MLEPHDLGLTKLERSVEGDVRDVMYLAQAGLINRETLTNRFAEEMEAYIGNPTRHGFGINSKCGMKLVGRNSRRAWGEMVGWMSVFRQSKVL